MNVILMYRSSWEVSKYRFHTLIQVETMTGGRIFALSSFKTRLQLTLVVNGKNVQKAARILKISLAVGEPERHLKQLMG
jgi:hypothetical protein